jgi:hypothetical protein
VDPTVSSEPVTGYEGVLLPPSDPGEPGVAGDGTPARTHTFDPVTIEVPVQRYEFEDDVIEPTPPVVPAPAAPEVAPYPEVLAPPIPDAGYPGILITTPPVAAVDPAPTLSAARASGTELEAVRLPGMMNPPALMAMAPDDRRRWYLERLGRYEPQLKESARAHGIPVRLLATVLLNELADINVGDISQDVLPVYDGSLGIAQIQIDTAVANGLFDPLSTAELNAAKETLPAEIAGLSGHPLLSMAMLRRMAIARRLRVPQHAIEGAAKHIRQLLDKLDANTDKPWATSFGYVAGKGSVYDRVAGDSPARREVAAATMVAGAYNSPDIIVANEPMKYRNGPANGFWAGQVAADLHAFGLFSE